MSDDKRIVSSMRVPVRARTCRRNCPASTLGKKSCPNCGTSIGEDFNLVQDSNDQVYRVTLVVEDEDQHGRGYWSADLEPLGAGSHSFEGRR